MEHYFDYQENPTIRVYMNEILKAHKTYTKALFQLSTAATLDGVLDPVIAMPDLTPAFGLPVGSVLAINAEEGVISLNAIGGDINCGISLSQTNMPLSHFFIPELNKERCKSLLDSIKKQLNTQQEIKNYRDFFALGASALSSDDYSKIEDYGQVNINNLSLLNDSKILEIAKSQLGTLGGGNHFIDLLYCNQIYDEELSMLWGIEKDKVLSMLHTGSRGIGSYIKKVFSVKLDTALAEIVFQPRKFNSKEGKEILNAINLASNFAYANRAAIRSKIDMALREFDNNAGSNLIYDFGHNNITLEDEGNIILHRKGASRGLPKNHPKNTSYYMETGHPIIIPGSLGTSTYILVGTDKLKETHYSVNHGAGRKYQRGYVESKKHQPRFREKLENVFVNLMYRDYCSETPNAYKDIEEVIKTLESNGFVKRVAKLQPFFVYLEKDNNVSSF